MKKIVIITFLTFLVIELYAQEPVSFCDVRPCNNLALNVNDGALVSLSYERLFFTSSRFFIACKAGLGYNKEFELSNNQDAKNYFIIPHHITGNLGKGKSFFEFGLGGAIVQGETDKHYIYFPIAGFRFQPDEFEKLQFRVFVYYPIEDHPEILAGGFGVSLGYSF